MTAAVIVNAPPCVDCRHPPVEVRENSLFGCRDILTFDMLPEGWAPSE